MTAVDHETRVDDLTGKAVRQVGTLSTAERVGLLMTEVGAVPKDGRAPEKVGGYKFQGIEDIVAHLAPKIHSYGLTFRVETMAHRVELDADNPRRRTAYVTCSYSLVGPDADAFLLGSWVGEADDYSGDKATNKAFTAARKRCLIEAFTVPTRDVEVDTESVPPAGGPTSSETEQPKGPDGPPGDVSGPWEKVADAARAGVKRGDIERRDDGRWHRVGTPDHTVDPHAAAVARDKAALTAAANAREDASGEPF